MPYADASNVILLRANEDRIKSATDLSGKIIGVQIGSAAAGIIKVFEAKLKAEGKPGYADVKQYQHYPEAYRILINAASRCSGKLEVHHDGGNARRAGPIQDAGGRVGYHGIFRHGLSQGGREFQEFVNVQLAEMKSSGSWPSCRRNGSAARWKHPTWCLQVLP